MQEKLPAGSEPPFNQDIFRPLSHAIGYVVDPGLKYCWRTDLLAQEEKDISRFCRKCHCRYGHLEFDPKSLVLRRDPPYPLPTTVSERNGLRLAIFQCYHLKMDEEISERPQRAIVISDIAKVGIAPANLAILMRRLHVEGIVVIEILSCSNLVSETGRWAKVLEGCSSEEIKLAKKDVNSLMRKVAESRRGERFGQVPFGELNDREKKTLSRMRFLRRKPKARKDMPPPKPMSYRQIAKQLDREFEKYPTRHGEPWQARTVKLLLNRPRAIRRSRRRGI